MKKYYEAIIGSGGEVDWQKEYSKLASQLTAKEVEIKELKERCISWAKSWDENKREVEGLKTELKYWKELAEAQENVMNLVDFGLGVKDCSQTSPFGKAYDHYIKLKNQKPNSEQEVKQ